MSKNGITEQVEDALTYPILTQPVDSQPSAQTSSVSTGASLDSIAQNTIRRVLGWRFRAGDIKGFTAALTKSFTLKQVEGHVEWDLNPQNYMAQADLGEVTGAQASIYSRAKVALDQIVPLLDGLTPLREDADPEDCEAIRSIIRSELKDQLVPELGKVGGPRVQLVQQIFNLLLGPDPVAQDPENVRGQLEELRKRFGLRRKFVNTVDEEVTLTNFLIIVDYINSLYNTWQEQAKYLGRQNFGQPFLGTQFVLLSQQFDVVAESVRQAYDAMDSVFFGQAERETTQLSLNGEPWITVAELLKWVEDSATVLFPQLVQDGGRDGVVVVATTSDRLYGLVDEAWKQSKSSSHNPARGFHTARTQRAFEEIRSTLKRTRNLAGEVNAPADSSGVGHRPVVTGVSPDHTGANAGVSVRIDGTNLSSVNKILLVRQNPSQIIDGTQITHKGDSQLNAQFDLRYSQPGELDLVLLTKDGLRVERDRVFTVQDPAPSITNVEQTIVEESYEVLLEITGDHFQRGAVVTLTSGTPSVEYTGHVHSLTEKLIVVRFNLSLLGTAVWQLVVTNPDQQVTPPQNFAVVLPPPIIKSFVPKFVANNTELDLTIHGRYFQTGATVSLQAEGLTVIPHQTTVKSPETIMSSFDLTAANSASAGLYFVVVTNHPDGQEVWSDKPLEIFDPASPGHYGAQTTVKPMRAQRGRSRGGKKASRKNKGTRSRKP
jgi:hypothetical protein